MERVEALVIARAAIPYFRAQWQAVPDERTAERLRIAERDLARVEAHYAG